MAWIQSLSAVYNFIRPILDIAILAFLLYKAYELLAKTHALQLVKGAVFLLLVYGIAYLFKLSTLQWTLSILWPGIFITIAIVFQPEFRKIIIRLGQGGLFKPNSEQRISQLEIVVTAAELLSIKKRGMLAVFPRKISIKNIIDTGTKINADISSNLIVSIFEFDGPLHDGAMVIQHGKIAAAGCLLPLSEQEDTRHNWGTRHRAALGTTEQSDAVVLVVSEETGALSLAYDTRLHYDLSPDEVTRKLTELLDKGARKEADAEPAPEPEKEDVIVENQ
jgi:diadenylate cyclase